MQAKGNRFIRRLVGYVVATLALFAGSLAVADSASAEDDVLWVDLDFYGASSPVDGLVTFYDGSSRSAVNVPKDQFGEVHLRLLTQQVDKYYQESTDGQIRFRYRSWHPMATTENPQDCESNQFLPLYGYERVREKPEIAVEVYAGHCSESQGHAGRGVLGAGHSWIFQASAIVLAHEIGHNLGMHHAGTQECTLRPIDPCRTSTDQVEYGWDRDVMGALRQTRYPEGWVQINDATWNLARYRSLDPANLSQIATPAERRLISFTKSPDEPTVIRLNAFGSGENDILTLTRDHAQVHLAYQADPSRTDSTPLGVEAYALAGRYTMRHGPTPLEEGVSYGGDLGYAVKVIRTTPEYAEIEVADAGEPLAPPADLTAEPSRESVTLTWTPPPGRTVLGVRIERWGPSIQGGFHPMDSSTVLSWNSGSATVRSIGRFRYRVQLQTTQGFTPFGVSDEVSNAEPPGIVTSAVVRPVDSGVYLLPTCVNGGSRITSYLVRYTPNTGLPVERWQTAVVAAENRSRMTGLDNGQEYSIQVACINEAGTGPFSSTYKVTPSPPPQPPVIARYIVEDDWGYEGYAQIRVWLRAAEGSEDNSSRLKLWPEEGYWSCTIYRGEEENPCILRKLIPKKDYVFNLVAMDDVNKWGPVVTKVIKTIGAPTAPSNVRAEAESTSAVLSWDPSTAYAADVITYEVRDESNRLLCSTTETQCSITLPEQGAWTVTITAFNDGVASPTTTFQGVVQGNPPPPDPPVSPPPPDPPASPPPTTQPPSTPPPTDPTGPPTPPPTGNPGSKPAEDPGAGSGHADPILGGGVPSTDTPSDIVRLQTIRKPRRTVRVGTTWKVPKRTLQGQRASWKSAKTSVCTVKKGKRLVFRKRGKCIVSVTAPSTLNLLELRKTFTVRVKGRR